jgi:hypothetical protein
MNHPPSVNFILIHNLASNQRGLVGGTPIPVAAVPSSRPHIFGDGRFSRSSTAVQCAAYIRQPRRPSLPVGRRNIPIGIEVATECVHRATLSSVPSLASWVLLTGGHAKPSQARPAAPGDRAPVSVVSATNRTRFRLQGRLAQSVSALRSNRRGHRFKSGTAHLDARRTSAGRALELGCQPDACSGRGSAVPPRRPVPASFSLPCSVDLDTTSASFCVSQIATGRSTDRRRLERRPYQSFAGGGKPAGG